MTNMNRAALGSLSFLALIMASCSTQRPAPRPVPAPRVPPQPAVAPALYVAAAGSIDLFIVRASDLALVRSNDARIRALAVHLREDHRGLASQLSIAGRRLNTLPAARLTGRQEQCLTALETTQPFDGAYLRQMTQAHDKSLALHAAFAARGSSPTLRPVAANAARVERRHLAELRALNQS